MKILRINNLLIGILISLSACGDLSEKQPEKPNVLFIICDDLNDYVEGMEGHPQAVTPNIARLASEGISFTNAHSNHPVCAPCRASLFTGIYPHTSGLYSFEQWFLNPTLKDCKTMMELFRENGYRVLGTGKILHHHVPDVWDEYGIQRNHGPWPFNGTKDRPNPPWDGLVAHSSIPLPFGNNPYRSFAPLSDVPDIPAGEKTPGYKGWWDGFGPFNYEDESKRDLMPDEKNVAWFETKLRYLEKDDNEKPFFMAVGFNRPHTPLYAPEKYFDLFPLEDIILPPHMENDLDDCAWGLVNGNAYPKGNYKRLIETYRSRDIGLKQYLRAYMACVTFVDDQLGKVLNALENSAFAENTIVIFTSDHGYHLGEKDQLFKHTLWEESTRIPFMFKVPGMTRPGTTCDHPVSLIDIYTTLVDLCNLGGSNMKDEEGAPLDGYSLHSFLINPAADNWPGPDVALSAILSDRVKEGNNIPMKAEDQHFSVRSVNWRYSLAYDNSEELYDHTLDSNEWNNLAVDLEHQEVKSDLKKVLLKLTGRNQ